MKNAVLSSILIGFISISFIACSGKEAKCYKDECGNTYLLKDEKKDIKCTPEVNININEHKEKVAEKKEVVSKKETCEELQRSGNYKNVLCKNKPVTITVVGQGVAPCSGGCSPAQSYALAKRAAIADSYRLIAEKVKGVYVEGDDLVKNMMVKRSTVRTSVNAMVRNANLVETTFKDGLCEVEMEILISYGQFMR